MIGCIVSQHRINDKIGYVEQLAVIYAIVGEDEAALGRIDELLVK